MSFLVPCDAVGCRNGFIGGEECAKCGGSGYIEITEKKNRTLARALRVLLLLGVGVLLFAVSYWRK